MRKLLTEIVEIETLGLAVLIMRNHQIRKGLRFRSTGLGIAFLLALRFTLSLLSALFLTRALLLSLGEGRTRASCHMSRLPLNWILVAALETQYSKIMTLDARRVLEDR